MSKINGFLEAIFKCKIAIDNRSKSSIICIDFSNKICGNMIVAVSYDSVVTIITITKNKHMLIDSKITLL